MKQIELPITDVKIGSWVRFTGHAYLKGIVVRGNVREINDNGIALVQEATPVLYHGAYGLMRGAKMMSKFYDVPLAALDVICAPPKIEGELWVRETRVECSYCGQMKWKGTTCSCGEGAR